MLIRLVRQIDTLVNEIDTLVSINVEQSNDGLPTPYSH